MKYKLGQDIDPCFDFHKFACGNYSGESGWTSERSITFEQLIEAAPSTFQFIKDFYSSCTHNITYENDTIVEGIVPDILDRPIFLVGGKGDNEGYVMVKNSQGYVGPICDDAWDKADVSYNSYVIQNRPIWLILLIQKK